MIKKAINRLHEYIEYKKIKPTRFEKDLGLSNGYIGTQLRRNADLGESIINKIIDYCLDLNPVWFVTGKGKMLLSTQSGRAPNTKSEHLVETRPRIPFNAPMGALSAEYDNLTEDMPLIQAFSKYDFTIIAKGDSMFPEAHPGDEMACMYVKPMSFIQWGRFHVLDTSQGVIIKRIFDDNEYFLCTSENSDLYKDFRIHKSEVYNIALVVGIIRRY